MIGEGDRARGSSTRDLRRLRAATAVVWLSIGLGLTFGPPAWRSSRSFQVIASFLPLRAWGAVFLAIGAVQLLSMIVHQGAALFGGLIIGAAVAAAWATSFVAAGLVHSLTGPAGPSLWGFLAFVQIIESGRSRFRYRNRWMR